MRTRALALLALIVVLPSGAAAQPTAPDAVDPDTVRRACYAADAPDYTGWAATVGLMAMGTGLTLYGSTYRAHDGEETPVRVQYARGMGPGLILGAIGTPFLRNSWKLTDTLRALCATVERNGRNREDDTYDTFAADRALDGVGTPPSTLQPVLITLATAACAGASLFSFATKNTAIAGVAGGASAAAVAAWVIVPATPEQSAARSYRNGHYADEARAARPTLSIIPLVSTPGLAAIGTF